MQNATSTSTEERHANGQTLTARDVAERYGLTLESVWRHCRDGVLPHARISRTIRFDKATLDRWFENGGTSRIANANETANKQVDQ